MQDAIDFNDQIEWLEKIEISSLTNRALTIASRLAHGIRRINGEVVQLQRATMAVQLAEQVVAIDDEKLNKLFRDFLEEALRVDDSGYPTPLEVNKKVQYAG